jgi:hypothetical protein
MATPKPTFFTSGATRESLQKALGAGVAVCEGVAEGEAEGEEAAAAGGATLHCSRRMNAPSAKYMVPFPAGANPLGFTLAAVVAAPSRGGPAAHAPVPAMVYAKPPLMAPTLFEKELENSSAPVAGSTAA